MLDLGCGLGGYSKALAERGFDVRAFDVVPEYVERARGLGVRAEVYDGERLPLPDESVDTAILLEVLEHLEDPAPLLREARRVARRGVLVTTPNCTQSFGRVPIEFSHMLDVDHRQYFTADSLAALLDDVFGSSTVEQVAPIDRNLAGLVLPRPLRPLYRALDRLGQPSRGTSSGCADAPPPRDARPVHLGRAARPVDGRAGDPRAGAGAGGRRRTAR